MTSPAWSRTVNKLIYGIKSMQALLHLCVHKRTQSFLGQRIPPSYLAIRQSGGCGFVCVIRPPWHILTTDLEEASPLSWFPNHRFQVVFPLWAGGCVGGNLNMADYGNLVLLSVVFSVSHASVWVLCRTAEALNA